MGLCVEIYLIFPPPAATQTTTNSLETSTSPESSTSPETTWESCTEALVMTGCIGFIVGIVATLLVALPTFLLCCKRKLKMSRYVAKGSYTIFLYSIFTIGNFYDALSTCKPAKHSPHGPYRGNLFDLLTAMQKLCQGAKY